jgi:hypothetical protein
MLQSKETSSLYLQDVRALKGLKADVRMLLIHVTL